MTEKEIDEQIFNVSQILHQMKDNGDIKCFALFVNDGESTTTNAGGIMEDYFPQMFDTSLNCCDNKAIRLAIALALAL